MKVLAKILLVAGLVVGLISVAMAGTSDQAQSTVTITFDEIAELAVSGSPGLLTIAAPATPGTLPAEQQIAGTTMSWTSNVATSTRKITGSLATLFEGIDLYATVAASGGTGTFGTSAGPLKFAAAATAYNFVTGIGNGYITAQTITFKATPTAMVTPYIGTAKVVTWTLTEDGA